MSSVKTTIKTENCSFSEYRIYPGRGTKFISKDGKSHLFINSKADSLFHQRIKPVRLTWTQSWRRMNKKMRHLEGAGKRKTRKTAKVQKAIVGLSLEDIKKKSAIKKAVPGARAAALKEARARQAAKPEVKSEKPKTVKVQAARSTIPKNLPSKVSKTQASSRR